MWVCKERGEFLEKGRERERERERKKHKIKKKKKQYLNEVLKKLESLIEDVL